MKVLVTGGSGFVGAKLVEALRARGDDVVVTTRSEARARKKLGSGVGVVEWDPSSGPIEATALAGVDGIVNLAGEPVPGRWNKAKKERIRDSRVVGTRHLVAGIEAADPRPKVLVSASAIGYYGDTKHNAVHEDAPPADDFLAGVCQEWEAEARRARELDVRTAIVRIGVVLGKKGGAYPLMTRPLRTGLGGTIGLGKMWMSWVHVDDVIGIFLHCLDNERADRVYNATAPNPVSNWEFTKTFGAVKRRPTALPVPATVLRLLLGEFAQVITASQRVRPVRTLGLGYEFKCAKVRDAIEDLENVAGKVEAA